MQKFASFSVALFKSTRRGVVQKWPPTSPYVTRLQFTSVKVYEMAGVLTKRATRIDLFCRILVAAFCVKYHPGALTSCTDVICTPPS